MTKLKRFTMALPYELYFDVMRLREDRRFAKASSSKIVRYLLRTGLKTYYGTEKSIRPP